MRNLGYSASVTLDIPVWDWLSTEHKVKQSEIRRDAAQVALSATQRRLIARLDEAYSEAAAARDQLASLDASVATAGESLRLTKLRYTGGEATVLEVVDAQSAFVIAAECARRRTGALRDGAGRSANADRNHVIRKSRKMSSKKMSSRTTSSMMSGSAVLTSWNRTPDALSVKRRWVLLCAMALPVVLLPGCKKEAAPEPLVTVQAEHPEQGPIAEHITADAVLAPLAQAAIAPKISAPVRKFYVQRGSRVKEGQLLATLENNDLAAAAMDNKGSYVAAQAAYATATKAQVPEDTLKAESDVAQAKANLDLNLSIVKSRKQLFAEGRDSRPRPGHCQCRAGAGPGGLRRGGEASGVGAQREPRGRAASPRRGSLTSAEGKYKGAEAAGELLRDSQPHRGVVTDRPLFAGETAAAGAPLITVMETSTLLAKTHIAQSLAQHMKVGDEASVQRAGTGRSGRRKGFAHQSGARPRQHDRRGLAQDRQQGRNAQSGHAGQGLHHRQNRGAGMEDSGLLDSDRAGRQQIRDGGGRRRHGASQARDAGH